MKYNLIALFLMLSSVSACSQNDNSSIDTKVYTGKSVYIPKDLQGMDLNDADSKWSYSRSDTTADFIIFWEKGFGKNLNNAPKLEGKDMNVNLSNLKSRLETFYKFYKDTLKFVKSGSNSEKYRMMVMLNYSLEGTAYGGDYDQVIGALWIAPNRVQDTKLNCIAHELGHCFQSQVSCDKQGDAWGGCGFFEMTSQWMLWQVNPYWVTDEEYHWDAFKALTHKAYLHLDNIYHSPYVLEYWGMKHGLTVIADLYRAGKIGEDPVMTYKRLENLSQSQFNDEMFDADCHIINFDYPRVWKQTRQYACTLSCKLEKQDDGWYRIDDKHAPENYGFNVIPLSVPAKGNKIKILFHGLDGINVTAEQAAQAGWRYGFVGVTSQGKSVYGDVAYGADDTVSYQLPKDIEHLYFVVMGAPKEHWKNIDEGGNDAAWPYKLQFTGTHPLNE